MQGLLETVTVWAREAARSNSRKTIIVQKETSGNFLKHVVNCPQNITSDLSDLCHGHHVLRRQNFPSRPEWIEQGAWDMANTRLKVKACDANESLQLFLFVSGHLLKSEL
jgi:hypothetical protein